MNVDVFKYAYKLYVCMCMSVHVCMHSVKSLNTS